MKLITYSVWGKDPLYYDGIMDNAILASSIYPTWTSRVYHDDLMPADIIHKLNSLGTETCKMPKRGAWNGLFWRFLPAGDPSMERVIVRDADSRINWREKAAVEEWINSGLNCHVMRDHYEHNSPMMGGMWGCKGGTIPDMDQLIVQWPDHECKGADQEFLRFRVWPVINKDCLVHDRYDNGLFILPDGTQVTMNDCKEYNPWDGLGRGDLRYPTGRICLKDGRKFKREDLKYEYIPMTAFGPHMVRPFPPHPDIKFGSHVGEIIKGRVINEGERIYPDDEIINEV